jgi:hypothetical protein
MRARINVSLTPADRPAVWSRHTQDVYAAARSIPRANEAVEARIIDGAYDEANLTTLTWPSPSTSGERRRSNCK